MHLARSEASMVLLRVSVGVLGLLGLTTALGCNGSQTPTGESEPESPVTFQTKPPPSNPDTGDDETGETGDTEETGEETGDTDPGPPPPWTQLTVSPAQLTVGVGATVDLRVRGTDPDGERATPDPIVWTSSDLGVAVVIDGAVQMLAAGEVTITAEAEGMSASATLVAEEGGHLEITVVDRDTLAPIEGLKLQVGYDYLTPVSDKTGLITTDGMPSSPIDITVYGEGYITTTVAHVVGRRVTVGVRPADSAETVETLVVGGVDMSSLSPSVTQVGVGLVASSMPDPAWWFHWSDMSGPPRTVDMLGVQVTLPSNVVIADNAESWSIYHEPGAIAAWSMGTVMPIAEALSAGNGDIDAFSLVSQHLDEAQWGVLPNLTITEKDTVVGEVDLVASFTEEVVVHTKDRPEGTLGDEVALIMTLAPRKEGLIATGLGTGFASVTVPHVANPPPETVIGIMQEDFLGSGRGTSVAVADIEGVIAKLPAWVAIPKEPVHYKADQEVRLNADPEAQLVMAQLADRGGHYRDYYAPAHLDLAGFPDVASTFDYGHATWDMRVVGLWEGSYEASLSAGPISPDTLTADVAGIGLIEVEIAAVE